MGLTLDAGGLIALERGRRDVLAMVGSAQRRGEVVSIPCGVLAQVWRGGRRQVRLALLLKHRGTELVPLGPEMAKAIGSLIVRAGVSDIVDVSVVLCARRRGDEVITSDPGDLRRIDPGLRVTVV